MSTSPESASSGRTVRRPGSILTGRSFSGSRTRTRRRFSVAPMRLEEVSALSLRARATPPPTTPNPSRTTFTSAGTAAPPLALVGAAHSPLDLVRVAATQVHVVDDINRLLLLLNPVLKGPNGEAALLTLFNLVGGVLLQHLDYEDALSDRYRGELLWVESEYQLLQGG